jgi:hypothetical protein
MYCSARVNARKEMGLMRANHLTLCGAFNIAEHGACALQPQE